MPRGERAWYGPFSPWINDGEKNEAVNQIRLALNLRALGQHAEARAVARGTDESTSKLGDRARREGCEESSKDAV